MTASPSQPTILVATDLSPASQAAFDSGVQLARDLDARLVLVHAVRPVGAPGLELTRPDTTTRENETAEPTPDTAMGGRDLVDLARSRGVEAEMVVRAGLPAVVIADEAERLKARTVVLGSLHKTSLEKRVLGSVAREVMERTDRPLLVVASGGTAA